MLRYLTYLKEYYSINKSGLFDLQYYSRRYPDVLKADINPLMHFIRFGWRERRNPSAFFNTEYYLSKNPDVFDAGVNPLIHYIRFGGNEGRDPSPIFNSSWYLNKYQDVSSAGINPLLHYIKHGKKQGALPISCHYENKSSIQEPIYANIQSKQETKRSKSNNADQTVSIIQKTNELYSYKTNSFQEQLLEEKAKTPDITVIIPLYNKSNYFRTCIESVLAQTGISLEIIIVDECSLDGSLDIAMQIAESEPRIKVIRNKTNKGDAFSRNLGISLAKGRYLHFADADDYLPDGALAALFKAAERTDSEVVRGMLQTLENDDSVPNTNYITDIERIGTLHDLPELWIPWWHQCFLISRDLVIKNNIKYPDLIAGEDPVLIANVLVNARQICVIPVATYVYRKNKHRSPPDLKKVADYVKHVQYIKDVYKQSYEHCWQRYRDYICNDFRLLFSQATLSQDEYKKLFHYL